MAALRLFSFSLAFFLLFVCLLSLIRLSSSLHSNQFISTAMIPITWRSRYFGFDRNVLLSWSNPDCTSCELRGGDCGFTSSTSLNVGCSDLPTKGLTRAAKYGIILGAVIPGLLLIMGVGSCILAKLRSYRQRHHLNQHISSSASTVALASVMVTGLDAPTIESYPKTLLGASRRLPKANHSTCSICLSEYQPTETLRTIPDCGHYFHAKCIDEWLKRNASCPLCRNSPEESSHLSLSSPTSSSSLLSLSSA